MSNGVHEVNRDATQFVIEASVPFDYFFFFAGFFFGGTGFGVILLMRT